MNQPVLSPEDVNRVRQWFNAVQDLNGRFLERADFQLAQRLGIPVREKDLRNAR